jgi:serine/threonine protein kinase
MHPEKLVGAVLNGRWRLLRLIGEGGMGAVYEAEGPPGEGRRAIKLLHQEFILEDAILKRFAAEAAAARSLQHPNVAQVLDCATAENGTPYIVMELLQGSSLGTYVDQHQALPPPQAVQIVEGLLRALTLAHARGIVHRDLKPDNVFLTQDAGGAFVAKVLDFGIAKVMDLAGGMGHKTRTGVLLGTPGYMSPEQIKNSKGVDARSDLWSVAVILYELLSGASPFPADNEFARLTSVLTEESTPIAQVSPHLAAWGPFFQRALAKEPAHRFQSAEEMGQSMLSLMRGTSLRPPPTMQGQGTQVMPSMPDGPPSPASMQKPQPPPHSLGARLPETQQSSPVLAFLAGPPEPLSLAQPLPHSRGPYGSSPDAPPRAAMPETQPASMPVRAPPPAAPRPSDHPQITAPAASMSPASLQVMLAMGQQAPYAQPPLSGPMPGPMSVQYGSVPPHSMAQPYGVATPGPPPAIVYGAAAAAAAAAAVGPTHVSGLRPPGTPTMQEHTTSVQVVDAPQQRSSGVAWWAVGVIAFVAFGLGLALGLALAPVIG